MFRILTIHPFLFLPLLLFIFAILFFSVLFGLLYIFPFFAFITTLFLNYSSFLFAYILVTLSHAIAVFLPFFVARLIRKRTDITTLPRFIYYLYFLAVAIFYGVFALYLIVPFLYEFASIFIVPFGIISISSFIIGAAVLARGVTEIKGQVVPFVTGIILISAWGFLSYTQINTMSRDSWMPIGNIVEKFFVAPAKEISKSSEVIDISGLVFASSKKNYSGAGENVIIIFSYDADGNKEVLNKLSLPLRTNFLSFIENGQSFIYGRQEDAETKYYRVKVGGGRNNPAVPLRSDIAELLLGREKGLLSPNSNYLISNVYEEPVDYEEKYYYAKNLDEQNKIPLIHESELVGMPYPVEYAYIGWVDNENILMIKGKNFFPQIEVMKKNVISNKEELLYKISTENKIEIFKVIDEDRFIVAIPQSSYGSLSILDADNNTLFEASEKFSGLFIFHINNKEVKQVLSSEYSFLNAATVVSRDKRVFIIQSPFEKFLFVVDLSSPPYIAQEVYQGEKEVVGISFK